MSDTETRKNSSKRTQGSKKKSFQKGEIVTIARSCVVEDDLNPRYISPANAERLKKSIRNNGLVGPLVWNSQTGHIVGGHQRLDALDELMGDNGDYDLQVVKVDLPLKEEIKLNVVLNNGDSMGVFDFAKLDWLANEFSIDVKTEFGFSQEVVDLQFPDLKENNSFLEVENAVPARRVADEAEIAKMKELKKETREKLKESRNEIGDYKTEAKGVLTLVFETETMKRNFLSDIGLEDSNCVFIDDFLESYDEFMKKGDSSETSESQE